MNKICVYAICKNEAKYVKSWLDSMQEADYIVVLDTGSTDETFQLLKQDSRVTRVEQRQFEPFRFDTARNASLELVPRDANILICTDLDELLDPGWATPLREKWIDGVHSRGEYKYAWSHKDNGEPGRIFRYNKIHRPGWKWRAPVHELLVDEQGSENYTWETRLDLFDEVYLHHYPDLTKSRSNYLPLLELRHQETPDDYYGTIYLCHEYSYRGMYEKSNKLFDEVIQTAMQKGDSLIAASSFLFVGDNERALGNNELAIEKYRQAIIQEPSYREPYLNMAEVCNAIGEYSKAVELVFDAIEKSYRHFSWLERDDSWGAQPYDILSVSFYYLGDIDLSKVYVDKAYALDPNNERIETNRKLINSAKQYHTY